jgi:hypothetical protein
MTKRPRGLNAVYQEYYQRQGFTVWAPPVRGVTPIVVACGCGRAFTLAPVNGGYPSAAFCGECALKT